ncbi:MAG: hypothetical protein C7B47_06855 [Sulfobacillus thermosulfidooxidans]|uniref:Uncharacterized protein n=1 Tax=Sulfobacillus thermosulfidooxidans TaxID=28034 RepID=A0A2T2X0H0_SULTH|nr:MAG: hypothetical protein C7B47_06855 [Sulfobacillus thermosulfidooxidans]
MQTLAAVRWWDSLSNTETANHLFQMLTPSPSDDPVVLMVLLATMFRQAADGAVDEAFFEQGYRSQRVLAEMGELVASQMLCHAMIALSPPLSHALRLTLRLGTTFCRSGINEIHTKRL